MKNALKKGLLTTPWKILPGDIVRNKADIEITVAKIGRLGDKYCFSGLLTDGNGTTTIICQPTDDIWVR